MENNSAGESLLLSAHGKPGPRWSLFVRAWPEPRVSAESPTDRPRIVLSPLRLGRGPEQEVVDGGLVLKRDRADRVATRAAAVLRSVDVFDSRSAWSNALLRLAANSSDQVCKRANCSAQRGQQAETEREHHHADHPAADCVCSASGRVRPVNGEAPSPECQR